MRQNLWLVNSLTGVLVDGPHEYRLKSLRAAKLVIQVVWTFHHEIKLHGQHFTALGFSYSVRRGQERNDIALFADWTCILGWRYGDSRSSPPKATRLRKDDCAMGGPDGWRTRLSMVRSDLDRRVYEVLSERRLSFWSSLSFT